MRLKLFPLDSFIIIAINFCLLSSSKRCYTTNPKMATLKQVQRLFIALFIFIIATSLSVHAQELPVVNSIEIQGIKRIEETAIKSKISQKVGEPISQAKLKEKLTITTGSIADAVLIQDNTNKLRSFYEEEGYWLASIVPVIRKVKPEEVGLTYQIAEGPKVKIDKIVIEGNKALSTKQIKKVMSTRKWSIFSFITSSGYYKKDQMDIDLEKIRDLYFNNGYIKVAVGEPKINLTADRKEMVITILIAEGSPYNISSVKFSGNKIFSDDIIKGKITLAPNKPFSKQQLRKDIFSIAELYSENGYAVATVTPDLIPDENNKLVEVFLKIEEGDKYSIRNIEISGNTKTRDKVIRREVRLDEGDIFNSALIKRSYEKINNLNFFKSVVLDPN